MHKILMFLLNLILILAMMLMTAYYTDNVLAERTATEQASFAALLTTMKQVSSGYLSSEQEYTNNWGGYLTEHDFGTERALEFLSQINTNDHVDAHLLDPITLTGYAVHGTQVREVSYASCKAAFKGELYAIASARLYDAEIHMTSLYNNPDSGANAVAFGRRVLLTEPNGKEKSYLLLRVLPAEAVAEQLLFPDEYADKAQIGLIAQNGNYIVKSDAMQGENFYSAIGAANAFSAEEGDELRARMRQNEKGILQYKNAAGEDCVWAYSSLGENNEWFLIGYIPVGGLVVTPVDWQLSAITSGMLIVLMLIDGYYFFLMAKKLRKASAEAKQASEAKTNFLSSMSHDIRTPMNTVIGMTDIASRHLDDPERTAECLQKISMASNHLLTLVNDILDISKVESGKFTLNPMTFSLADTMSNLVNIVRPAVRSKGLEFEVHVHHMEHEYLYADELRLNQIFINLLSNAVKYTPEGGSVTVDLEQRSVPDAADKVELIYTVKDTGIGMSEEYMKIMFDLFTRAKDSRVDTIQGSGLGLTITKQMVDLMNGTIDAQSELGKGTTFTVRLILSVSEGAAEEVSLNGERILIVDDDAIFAETASETVASLGATVATANSGEAALAAVQSAKEEGNAFSVILLDWRLPGQNGAEIASRIRSAIGNESSILLVSAYDWTDFEQEAQDAGVDGFLAKPLFRSTLCRALRDILQRENGRKHSAEEEHPLAGLHFLVAEDNDLNWEILEELLSAYGMTADRAENGLLAVQKLTESGEGVYDAVLMDIQMPVMNGREATKAIRASAIPYVRSVPVIAMTADAFAEDVRNCLAVGMNGHVSKPLDMKKFCAEVERVLGK